jgi:hypothetical protein
MQRYIDACACSADATRIEKALDTIIAAPGLHARFVNTLARMEYVGVRKLLKSRRAEHLDLDGLQHMLDENVHALRLKKAATALGAPLGVAVATFSDAHTLAGDAGEEYLQALDRRAEGELTDLAESRRAEVNVLMTTAAVEVRAQVFYPLYDRLLGAHRAGFSVALITKDEDRHLTDVGRSLEQQLTDWRPRFDRLMEAEATLFRAFLDQVDAAVAVASARAA